MRAQGNKAKIKFITVIKPINIKGAPSRCDYFRNLYERVCTHADEERMRIKEGEEKKSSMMIRERTGRSRMKVSASEERKQSERLGEERVAEEWDGPQCAKVGERPRQ